MDQIDSDMTLLSRRYEEVYYTGLLDIISHMSWSFLKLDVKAFK